MPGRLVLATVTVLLAVFLLTGCSGTVTGEVSSKSSSEPIAGATVKVGAVTVTTDAQGHFAIDEVDIGSAAVEVTADGYGPYSDTIEIERGDNTLNVILEDGTVLGVLRENAAAKEKLEKAKVIVAGEKATVDGQRFEVGEVPVGTQTVKVTAPGHETYEETIEVLPGENSVKVALNLTPLETYTRYYQSYRFGRYRDSYRFLHPDVRKHRDYKEFAKSMRADWPVVGIKLFEPRTMKKWRCPWAKKTYKDIVAIDRSVRYQTPYGNFSENYTQHWQQIDGRWFIIIGWE